MKNFTICFDLDGTILDVSLRYYNIYRDIVAVMKSKPLTFNSYWRLRRNGRSLEDILLTTTGKRSKNISTMYNRRLESPSYLKYDRVIVGGRSLLKKLSKKHFIAMVTARKSRRALNRQLNDLKIKHFFNEILVAESRADGEKSRINLIRKSMDIKNAVMVGDTEVDIRVGKKLKMKAVAVLSGLRGKNILVKEKPDFIIKSVLKLPNIIERIERASPLR